MATQPRNSILCPNCAKLISIDERQCPFCGTSNPGRRWKRSFLTRPFNSAEELIRLVLYANIGMFVIALIISPRLPGLSVNPFALLSPANKSLLLLGATGTIPIDQLHRWWTLVAANYLHGGILHILFNMVAFRQLALFNAREYGVARMFIIYTVTGIAGFLASYLVGITFTIGASAAVCGLMGSALYYGKSRGGAYGQMIYKQIGGWAVFLFIFGFLMPGINNWGHGGGLVAGVVLGYVLGYREKTPERLWHKTGAAICLLLTALVLIWAVIVACYYRFL